MRELVMLRLRELAAGVGETVLVDSYGEEHVVAELDMMSNKDLLALLEDLVGFNG
jgi:hypothetical protein